MVGGPNQGDGGLGLRTSPPSPLLPSSPRWETGKHARFATGWLLPQPCGSKPRPGHFFSPRLPASLE